MSISVIKKRDGRIAPFDVQKITNAINRSFRAGAPEQDFDELATSLALEVYTMLDLEGNPAPTVEHVQDLVEQVLMKEGYAQTAKDYILYREERTRVREINAQRGSISIPFHDREGSYRWLYRQNLRQALELLSKCTVARNTLEYFADTLAQRGLEFSTAADETYFEREADLICGTLGCERETVKQAQTFAVKYAKEEAELLRGLIQVH